MTYLDDTICPPVTASIKAVPFSVEGRHVGPWSCHIVGSDHSKHGVLWPGPKFARFSPGEGLSGKAGCGAVGRG